MNFTNPLIPVSVVDDVSQKPLPPTQSFLSVEADNLVLSAVKKSDLEPAILVRFYENNGTKSNTPVTFLGKPRNSREVNLLEEDLGHGEQPALAMNPYEIKTIRLGVER